MNPRLRFSLLAIALISSLTPIVWTLLASFGIRPDSQHISFDAYRDVQVFESRFVSELLTSFTVAVIVAALAITLGLLTAHALEQKHFKSRGLIVQSLLLLSSLPVLALLNGLSATLRTLGLNDTIPGIALAETALYAPLAAFVIFGHLRSMPENLSDAARLEGANTWTILWQIIVPSSFPALLATGVLVFVLSWNQVLMPLVLSTNLKLLPVALVDVFVFERELEWPTAAAALTISLVPLWLIVAFAFRWLEHFSLLIGVEER
jgi:ABC-type glycerol-3-phosphate transport system permease component